MDIASACCKSASSSPISTSAPVSDFPSSAVGLASAAGVPDSSISIPSPSLDSSFPSSAAAAAAAAAARSCLALSSSILTRRAMASSGSMFGSTPPYSAKAPPISPPPPPPPIPPGEETAPPPPPPWTIGLPTRTSLGSTPGGIVTRWHVLSPPSPPEPFAASTSSLSLGSFSSSSPMAITSIATLFFLSCFPARVSVRVSTLVRGDPTNKTMRCAPFLLRRCLSASDAT
mmetsp:Transcript_31965/g.46580  ORF Transcript_31965/g.46580 Transcript_31965/m.46580 type:complete len:230 (-) Transcript_31965:475-1164(-)